MNRILMAATVALMSSAPLAFAAASTSLSNAALTAEHCGYVDQQLPQTTFKSDAARQNAQEAAMSLCREDRHKNGGKQADGNAHTNRGAAPRS
ncbi:MAG TPA: hypothetical protein VGJ75_23910 [Dongiaceae bacterium]|jgi:hypothetical protein